MKICIDCRKEKAETEFKKEKKSKKGRSNLCKLCANKRHKLDRIKHLEKRREYDRNYYLIKRRNDPRLIAVAREATRRWRENHHKK